MGKEKEVIHSWKHGMCDKLMSKYSMQPCTRLLLSTAIPMNTMYITIIITP